MKNNRVDASALQEALQQLPESANQYLSYIQASETLKQRIWENAYLYPAKQKKSSFIDFFKGRILRYAISLCTIVFAIYTITTLSPGKEEKEDENLGTVFKSIPASVDTETEQTINTLGEVANSGLAVIANSDVQYAEIWVQDANGFPFIKLNNTVYRLLDLNVSNRSLLAGESAGSIEAQSSSSQDANSSSSNILAVGTNVYTIADMEDIFLASEKGKNLFLFQKYSNEKISTPVFPPSLLAQVKSVYVHSLGEITDSTMAKNALQEIINLSTALDTPSHLNDYLIIEFENGLKMQYAIDGSHLQAYGSFHIENLYQILQKYLP